MLVREAREIVIQWVMMEASQMPGFLGAFFHGSINGMTGSETIPPTSDVDVMIVLNEPAPLEKLGKISYRGLIIDASFLPNTQMRTAEQILGVSHLAGSFRGSSIISDPTGRLHALQADVANNYAKRDWVVRRCEHAEDKVRAFLHSIDEAAPFYDQVMAWLFGTSVITHILLASGLKNPTVRKRYLAARDLLVEYEHEDLYETLLNLLGCRQMTLPEVEAHLSALTEAFASALGIIRTPFPFAADISALARPVAIDGSRELIEQGAHREAVFWIAVTYTRCMKVIAVDGSPEIFAQHEPGWRMLLDDLGIRSPADIRFRSRQVLDALSGVWSVAKAIMDAHLEIN